jgi:hypothetical protein
MSKNILMISVNILRDRTGIHTNIDEKLIYPEIKVAQDMYIHPALGTKLYNKILDLIDAGTLTDAGNAAYKSLVDDYVIDTLCWYTMMQLPISLTAQFWNRGVATKSGEGDSPLTMEEMAKVSDQHRIRAEWYENRMRLFLVEDNAQTLPEWDQNGNRIDELHPNRRSFTMPVYLGGNDCGCSDSGKIPIIYDPTKCY